MEKPLTSWKEISSYLGCSQRTCIRWEKDFGLPVHRVGKAEARSRVFAYKEELDEWLKRRNDNETPDLKVSHPSGGLSRGLPVTLALSAAAVLIVFGMLKFMGRSSGSDSSQPSDFKIEHSQLIITNKTGRVLWRYDTGLADLADDAAYRAHFGNRAVGHDFNHFQTNLIIEDINGDGRAEVLFNVLNQDDHHQGRILCFDSKGRLLWALDAGRDITFGQKKYSADYAFSGLEMFNDGRSGTKKILVNARHEPHFPSYVDILSADGKLLGEYWNSGRISDYMFADVNGDRKRELVLAGTNNEYGKGCLIVLDPERVWGGSPQSGEYRSPDLKPGSELCYILFPRTEVDKLEFSQREFITYVDFLGTGRLRAIAGLSQVEYEFSPNLVVEDVVISDRFREKYWKYQDERKIPPGKLDEAAYANALAKGLLYWDGAAWESAPTMNKRNQEHPQPAQAK